MRDVLLDTHVWIWLSLDMRQSISKKASIALRESEHKWISAISCWELAKLVERKRIAFSIPTLTWMSRSLHEHGLGLVELTPEIAVESTQLKGFHNDPADQMIAATSRVLGMPLLTSDRRILEFADVETIW
jgi:PIN domain nuclease of toxin-antitoxin system